MSRSAVDASRHLARGIAFVAAHVGGGAIDLLFELADLLLHRTLAVEQLLHLLTVAFSRSAEPAHLVGDLLLFLHDLLGPARGIGDVTFRAARLRPLQLLLRLPQPFQCFRRLRPRCLLAVGGGTAHRVGGLTQLLRRLRQVGAILLARQLLEPSRRFFGLLRQLAL